MTHTAMPNNNIVNNQHTHTHKLFDKNVVYNNYESESWYLGVSYACQYSECCPFIILCMRPSLLKTEKRPIPRICISAKHDPHTQLLYPLTHSHTLEMFTLVRLPQTNYICEEYCNWKTYTTPNNQSMISTRIRWLLQHIRPHTNQTTVEQYQ